MGTHQIGDPLYGYSDKRRSRSDDFTSHVVGGPTYFTANAAGTTTTIVGANATPSTNTNVVKLGDEVKLFNSSNVLKEEKVFKVTGVAVAASTTVTFSPAAAVATASGDYFREVGISYSNSDRDARLLALGFSASRIATMTENDKNFQIRVSDDPGSL